MTIDDTCVVISEFHTRVRASVLDKKLMVNPYLIGFCSRENICIECTLVKDDYKYRERDLFSTTVVINVIAKIDKIMLVNRMCGTYK